MQVVDETVVHRNPYPSFRPESYSSTTVTWSRAGSPIPYLLAAFRLGSARMSPDGRIAMCTSHDGGRTWARVPSPLAAETASAVGATAGAGTNLAGSQSGVSAEGTTIVMAARMRMAEPGSPGWDDRAAGILDADTLVVRAGAGQAWEEAVTIDGRRHADEWAIPCGSPLALGSGRWLLPLERHARASVPDWLRGYHAFAALSDDDGRSWSRTVEVLNDPERRLAYYDQRMVLLPDGRILSLAWVHDVADDRTLEARAGWSGDGGLSWTAPVDTRILGGPVNPVVLPDGRVVAVYPRRVAPTGVRAVVSEDGGRTWLLDETIVIWDEAQGRVTGEAARAADRPDRDPALWDTMWGWTFGQPMPVVLGAGELGVCFFATGRDCDHAVRFVRLEV
jgi:hypothetical protein